VRRFIYIISLIVLSLIPNRNQAQNLVPNPSFELYDTCPYNGSQISFAPPWKGVTTNSTDYYNSCSSTYNVPFNGGFQLAKTGDAYAGLWTINPYGYNYREYLRIELSSPLQSDSCYFVEFFCNLHDLCRYGINTLGIYFSASTSNIIGPGTVLQNSPQIVSNGFLSDTLNWMRVSGYYQANGGEAYITIGNFSTDNLTDTIHTGGSYPGSYYLIDDVKVEKITGCDSTSIGVAEKDKNSLFKLYPNPSNGKMTLDYQIEKTGRAFLEITDLTGNVVAKYELSENNDKLEISQNELNNGVYIYHVIVNGRLLQSDKLIIIK
jgi:OmpA-OmpF porin, OOP family